MTPKQEHIALQNFKTSMIQSGHGDELTYCHAGGYFDAAGTQQKWLGYKRCWEEQILRENTPAQGTVANDYTPPNPNEEEFVFVGGPLHGLHHIDPNRPWVVTEQNGVQYLYIKEKTTRLLRDVKLPDIFTLRATHTLR